MNHYPAVSCFCMTYGRPAVLEEAIYSFLIQDYPGPKELIVLNDYAQQILHFDHPEVRVINLPVRFRTLGEKMNAAVALASHDLLFPWDDDDIYLPHRLRFSVAKFAATRGYFKARTAWFWNSSTLSGPVQNLFHPASCWSRRLFDTGRGYVADGNGCDLLFEQQLRRTYPDAIAPSEVALEEIYYIYRWGGTGTFHLSQFGELQVGQNVGYAEVADFVQQRARRGEIPLGYLPLQPRWSTDYRQLVSSYIATLAAEGAPAL